MNIEGSLRALQILPLHHIKRDIKAVHIRTFCLFMAGLSIQERHVLGCNAVQFDRNDGRFGRIYTSVSYL
jgi:hypothetical protein